MKNFLAIFTGTPSSPKMKEWMAMRRASLLLMNEYTRLRRQVFRRFGWLWL